MGTLSHRTQFWIAGAWLVVARPALTLLEDGLSRRPLLTSALALYGVFTVAMWTASPISNLLLRLNSSGRLLLTRAETVGATAVGICLAGAIVAGLLSTVTRSSSWPLLALLCVLLLAPVSAASEGYDTRLWPWLLTAPIVSVGCATAAVAMSFLGLRAAQWPLIILAVAAVFLGSMANSFHLARQ